MTYTSLLRNRQENLMDHTESETEVKASITTIFDGPDTESRVSVAGSNGKSYYGEGFAFLKKGDHYEQGLGEQLSVVRALIDALEDMEIDIMDASQTEDEYAAKEAAKARREDAANELFLSHDCEALGCFDFANAVGF